MSFDSCGVGDDLMPCLKVLIVQAAGYGGYCFWPVTHLLHNYIVRSQLTICYLKPSESLCSVRLWEFYHFTRCTGRTVAPDLPIT